MQKEGGVNTKLGRMIQRCHWSHCIINVYMLTLLKEDTMYSSVYRFCKTTQALSMKTLLAMVSVQPSAGLPKHICTTIEGAAA
jgi:hypothetical protein